MLSRGYCQSDCICSCKCHLGVLFFFSNCLQMKSHRPQNITGFFQGCWLISRTRQYDPAAENTPYFSHRTREISLVPIWKLQFYRLAFRVAEGAMHTCEEKRNDHSHPDVNPTSSNNYWPDKMCPLP